MEWEVSPFDRQIVGGFEFLDTPGDEVAPGSDEIGEDFQYKRLRHRNLLEEFKSFKTFKTFNAFRSFEGRETQGKILRLLAGGSQRENSLDEALS
jgi:hypothetical protein